MLQFLSMTHIQYFG